MLRAQAQKSRSMSQQPPPIDPCPLLTPAVRPLLPTPPPNPQLWSSASSNANPWSSTFYTNGAKPVGLAVNDFAHRTRHLLHVHLGTRIAKLRECARAAAAAINWAANTWSPSAYKGPECDFKGIPTANDGGHPDVWVYLDPAPASGGAPMGVGSAVWAAFNKGPLQSLKAPPSTTDIPAHHTSLAVTRVSNQGKNYFAILLANAAGKRNTGEYQFLESS
jgi:hypothetical protein